METMEFKTFKWPHNPTNFSLSYGKKIIRHEYPEIDGAEHEDLGAEPRILSGSGVFFGPGAYSNFTALQNLYYQRNSGKLWHPIWATFNARMTKLVAKNEPLPNYVEYEIEFVEDRDLNIITKAESSLGSGGGSSNSGSSKRYYTVVKGDSLWKIAKKYYGNGNKWKTIADANKNLIKNPDLIYPGWKLLIP